MGIDIKLMGLSGALFALVGISQLVACTTDDTDSKDKAGTGGVTNNTAGAPATGSGGSASTSGGSTAVTGMCASPITIELTTPKVADFDAWDTIAPLSTWSFALGGVVATGVFTGPFGYGDRTVGEKTDAIETFDMVEGAETTKYALHIADSMAQKYGGGMGLWLSACLNATNFTGVSFWVRGNSPTAKGTFSLSMGDTTSSTPTGTSTNIGTCPGSNTSTPATCIHPSFSFPVTDTWTQIEAPWTGFKAGSSNGTPVAATGKNVTQLQWSVELSWVPDATGAYVAVLAPYELAIDGVTFY